MLKKIKVLHIGNINENAYLNAKFLRKYGIEADVLVYDYRHVNGYPEWEDAIFQNYELISESNTNWNDYKTINGFKRPEWFKEINHYLPNFLKKEITGAKKILFNDLKYILIFQLFNPLNWPAIIYYFIYQKKIEKEYFKHVSKNNLIKPFTVLDNNKWDLFKKNFGIFLFFKIISMKFKKLFNQYDLIQAYSLDPILVYLSEINKPFISFEHATLKSIPLEDNFLGKLLTLAYQYSKKVIITNTDTRETAQKINLKNYTFIPHPIDTDKFKPESNSLKGIIKKDNNADLILLSPTRYNPQKKGSDKFLEGFKKFTEQNNNKKIKLILCNWSDQKKILENKIKEMDIANYVIIKPILPKMTLKEYYNAADIVIDQFSEGVMGTIAPEGMACGKPVIMHYDHEINKWAFPEKPPIVQANNPEEICNALKSLAENESLRKEIGKKGREWVEKYHSWKITTEKLIGVYEEVLGK